MPHQEEIIQKLRTEVERDGPQTERQCAKLLEEIAWVLLFPLESSPEYVRCNQISSVGVVDMVVVAKTWGAGTMPFPQAYVWELKAPQLELFEWETKDRARPTKYLYSAENQLLHYYHTIKKDGAFLKRMEILSGDHVHLGGIIIGRNRNYVRCGSQNQKSAMSNAYQAHEVREIYLYQRRIQLWTWDRVLDLANSFTAGYQKLGIGVSSGSTDVSVVQPSTEIIFKGDWSIVIPSFQAALKSENS